ncbi:MAG: GspE/PulE family protein [Francisellaceae bacterium]
MKSSNSFMSRFNRKSSENNSTTADDENLVPINARFHGTQDAVESYDDLDFKASRILFCEHNSPLRLSEEDAKQFLFLEARTKDDKKFLAVLISSSAEKNIEPRLARFKTEAKNFYGLTNNRSVYVKPSVIFECLQKVKKAEESKSIEHYVLEFDNLVRYAVANHATDIHVKVTGTEGIISMRIHGEIMPYANYDVIHINHLINAIYNGKGAEGQKDMYFDGKKKQQTIIERIIDQKKYRIRFASATIESNDNNDVKEASAAYIVALRILSTDKSSIRPLYELGYSEDQIDMLEEAQMAPSGGIIFAGTTGSGKSTSLAGLITGTMKTTGGRKKIISVESPVEYIIGGVDQLTVHESADMSEGEITHEFNLCLKTLMRLDPDIIYCNEIRNENTAQFAQKAIQSGHLFLSTIHAQDGLAIIERLCGIGMERDVACSPNYLQLLVYQTLVPTLCPHCAYDLEEYMLYFPDQHKIQQRLDQVIKRYSLDQTMKNQIRFRNNKGCQHCSYMGINGRTVIAEIVRPNAHILKNVRERNFIESYKSWRLSGGLTVKEHGLSKVLSGQICPVSLESKVGPLHLEALSDLFDQDFYAHILTDLTKRDEDHVSASLI